MGGSGVPLLADSPGIEQPAPRREVAHADNTPTPQSEETPAEHRDYGPPVEFVPGVPIGPAARPTCCVITSLTVTNNEAYPAYYVINGKSVPGMAPPLDQWVKPGKSITFKGDLGVCVRIEAFNDRAFDENGEPLTGHFDDETACCKDLVSGKNTED